jgi:hypothetical protein
MFMHTETPTVAFAHSFGPEGRESTGSGRAMVGCVAPGFAGQTTDGPPAMRARVRVNVGVGLAEKVGGILARHGGSPAGSRMTPVYEFASRSDRDDALDAVRSRFGWTSVDPEW